MSLTFCATRLHRPTVEFEHLQLLEWLNAFVRQPTLMLHDKLFAAADDLLEPPAVDDVSNQETAAHLARGILCAARLNESVAQGGVFDSTKSALLAAYRTDFTGAVADALAWVRELLVDADEIAATVEVDMEDACRKAAVVAAIRRRWDLATPDGRHGLLRAVYPNAPHTPDEVHVIAAPVLVLLCVEPNPAHADWLARTNSVTASLQKHFPAFSAMDTESVADPLLDAAMSAGLDETNARAELGRLFTVLPLDQVEKYAVHDIWGHAYQASLLRFDDVYQRLCATAATVPLEQKWPDVMSVVLAELFADVSEFKLARLMDTPPPNSSILSGTPTKLDLTLRDLQLLWPKLTPTEDWLHQPAIAWRDNGEVTLFGLVALQLLVLHRTLTDAYRAVTRLSTAGLPIDAWHDILLLTASAFFEHGRPRNLWRIDEFIKLKLLPMIEDLASNRVAEQRS
ncbi:MAG: hypothetical protein AAGD32_15115 [Planctomycetota bacterium]